MENTNMVSGACIVDNPFELVISGAISFGVVSSSCAIIACSSGAVINWAEQKRT